MENETMTRKKKILVLFLGRLGAGPEYAFEMTRGLLMNDCEVYAIISENCENRAAWDSLPLKKLITIRTPDGYKDALGLTIKFFTRTLRGIIRSLKDVEFDAVYTPMGHSWHGSICKAFKKKGASIITTIHDAQRHKGERGAKWFLMLLYERLFYCKPNKIVLLSESFVEDIMTSEKIDRKDIVIIPHGEFTLYRSSNKYVAEPISEYNFLFFGRILEYKGVGLLAQAFKKLSANYPNVSLRIIGRGDISPYMGDFNDCKNLYIDNRFVEPDEIAPLFKMKNTITVLPYIDASQSGIIPIAMREKSLLLVTNHPGLMEQTKNGSLAVTCEANAEDLYERMQHIILNFNSLESVIHRANEYIDSLSWDKLAAKLLYAID